jgi:hypothetical protein
MALTPWPAKGAEPDKVSNMLFANEVDVPRVPKTLGGAVDTALRKPNSGVPGPVLSAKHKDEIARLRGNGIGLKGADLQPIFTAYGYTGALPEGKLGMWDFLAALEKSPGFRNLQSGPGSAQHDILQGVVNNYHRAATKAVIAKDKDLMEQYLRYRRDAAAYKHGPVGAAMADKAIYGPGGAQDALNAADPAIQQFIKELTQ